MEDLAEGGFTGPVSEKTEFGTRSPLLASAHTVALVGNGPIGRDNATEIDAADLVIRMNRAPLCGVAGRRTDILVVNAYLEKAFGLYGKPIVGAARRDAREVWVQLNRADRAFIDGRPVVTIGREVIGHARKGLRDHGAAAGQDIPSLGTSSLQFLLDRGTADIQLFGFTHQGNDVHNWEVERRWADSLIAAGRVRRIAQKGSLVRQPLSVALDLQVTRLRNHFRGFRF